MGLDEQPDIRKQVDVSARGILRDVLMERLVKDVKPDEAAVDAMYKEMVREWKTASLLFQDDASARRARRRLRRAATSPRSPRVPWRPRRRAPRAMADYRSRKDYLPRIADAIAALRTGEVSPVIATKVGFVVITVTDVRYPDNREARAEAEKRVVGNQQLAVLQAHDQALRGDSVTIRKDVLDSLDYTAPTPGLVALQADKRVVADIKGGSPVTRWRPDRVPADKILYGPDHAAHRQADERHEGSRASRRRSDAAC